MTYNTSITSKGQITIPKKIRDILHLSAGKILTVGLGRNREEITIRPAEDFLEVAKKLSLKIKKKVNPLRARDALEKQYERR